MAVIPYVAHAALGTQTHREKEFDAVDFADIPSRTPVGFLLLGSSLDTIALCMDGEVPAHVTKLLTRSEMLSDLEAVKALQNEAVV